MISVRGNGRGVGAVAALALAITMASCAGGDDDAEGAKNTTITLTDLKTAARATADEPTLRFRTTLDAALPDPFGGSAARVGAFNRVHRRGSATLVTPIGVEPALRRGARHLRLRSVR